jgi:beta-lactamase superfamily II metal-dependent hydrolase
VDVRRLVGRLSAAALVSLLFGLPVASANDCVTPSHEVIDGVQLRAHPSTKSKVLGKLKPGQYDQLAGSVPAWHQLTLADGSPAFISKRWSVVATCPAAPTPPAVSATAPVAARSYTVHAIDVGTGLSVLIRGDDFAVLYDGGSNDDTAIGDKNRVVAYLKTLTPKLTRIDHVILSHPHRDHVELLADVLDQFEIGDVWDSGAAVVSHAAIRFHTPLQNFGQRIYPFQGGNCTAPASVKVNLASRIDESPIQLGQGAALTFLHTDGTQLVNLNENSLVVRIDLGGKRLLLMGDAEAGGRHPPATAPAPESTEGKLLACCQAELKADVMVVGHHGSETSSRTALLDAVGASIFVFSAGPTKYGSVTLPDQVIVDELTHRGQVFRTDIDDEACKANPAKIGPDGDGNPGGCSNIVIDFAANSIYADYQGGSD